jgi:hypothetical protein
MVGDPVVLAGAIVAWVIEIVAGVIAGITGVMAGVIALRVPIVKDRSSFFVFICKGSGVGCGLNFLWSILELIM